MTLFVKVIIISFDLLFTLKVMKINGDFTLFQGRDHLIVPLMAMVGELQRQQKELHKLLAAKDRQIDDYKAQGGQVTRSKWQQCCNSGNLHR